MELTEDDHGIWRGSVVGAHADQLLASLDRSAPFVLIETWDGYLDWHEAVVSVGSDDGPRPRTVRRHTFDLLVTPTEAVEIGRQLRGQGVAGGGLVCYQFRSRPHADFRLPDQGRRRADAMRGLGVELMIDLPHDGEVAVVSSPDKAVLEGYAARLG